ncbi:STAS domain-containing protein [Solirubrobacter phytolaccae]|uniref:Anti-sigma factor antagonist n=1 Tax=Solirubrobacter phytolaccae TaxID=1404360 RepID=A0A9X3NCR1_9ACTN|nr:STAS domain-containing protein [Solirubrobacter phytolaccae]MDA0184043.1 STAS domain-containing protein [Solirubrobacter phytolaccae]
MFLASDDVATRLRLIEHRVEGVSVLEVNGELDLYTAPLLCTQIGAKVDGPSSRLLIDLSHLQFCDSTGLRALVGAVREVRVAAGRVAMVRPARPGAARAFEIAGAAEFLPLVKDVDTGLSALADRRG